MNEHEIHPVADNLKPLRQQWFVWIVAASGVWAVLLFLLSASGQYSVWFMLSSAAVLLWQFWRLWLFLPDNRAGADQPIRPHFGPANWISIGRGALFAYLAGFILLPKADGWVAWLPASFYLVAVLLDYVDGAVARLTGSTSILGEKLDMDMDGLGILIATLVALKLGQVPLAFLLVGLARYLFLGGVWLRKRKGLPVDDLPPRRFRRGLAGAQMGFLATILFPVFTPPATVVAAYFFLIPFVLFFLLDFLAVSGWTPDWQGSLWTKFLNWVFVLRILLVGVGVWLVYEAPLRPALQLFLFAACLLLVLTGTAARIAALGLMLFAGFALRVDPLDPWQWALLLLSMLVFWLGSGRFSLWQPENFILYRRIGAASDER
jgi:CDP-diacylglycerol--glycerol-3-phosphate 3-phosphatidyltransferase